MIVLSELGTRLNNMIERTDSEAAAEVKEAEVGIDTSADGGFTSAAASSSDRTNR